MKEFHESMRYEYPLTENSLVIDLGAYEGRFSAEISKRYGCWVEAYEPIKEFYDKAKAALAQFSKVNVWNVGIGPACGRALFGVKGDMTGSFTDGNRTEVVELNEIESVIPGHGVDLMKINIEGGEYDLLDHMLRTGLHNGVKNIQVQFHGNVPNAKERWQTIRSKLLETHRLTYDAPFCWENYERIN